MRKIELGSGKANVPGRVFKDPEALADALAETIACRIRGASEAKRPFLLGCPTGRSPLETYRKLANIAGQTQMDLSHLVLVMMDEYAISAGDGFEYPAADAHYSCHRYAQSIIFEGINRHLPAKRRIRAKNLWFPDLSDPSEYDTQIRRAGGVDFFILASGASDLHVAFNPPGSSVMSRSRIVRLGEETRRDNMGTFPAFKELSDVPTHGISIGLKAISRYTQEVAMVIHGQHKRHAVATLDRLAGFDRRYPASVIYASRNATVWLDAQAAGDIGQTKRCAMQD
jgi:glucosamine-6-phosphate deaminase